MILELLCYCSDAAYLARRKQAYVLPLFRILNDSVRPINSPSIEPIVAGVVELRLQLKDLKSVFRFRKGRYHSNQFYGSIRAQSLN